MKKFVFFYALFLLWIGSALFTKILANVPDIFQAETISIITSVDTFDFLNREPGFFDKDTLVIFDVDKVLLAKKDPWERGYLKERQSANTIASLYIQGSELFKNLDKMTRDYLWSLYARDNEVTLIDSNVPVYIKKLQEKSVKVMALTNFVLGRIGIIPCVEEWRIQQLLANGVDFKSSFPKQAIIIFKQFVKDGKSPVFKKGVLFTGSICSKGDALNAFLKAIKWWPKRVVMIDDKMENLLSVQERLKALHISFRGYEYKGYATLPAFFNKEVAEFQMRYLMEHKQWISAKKAKALLKLSVRDFKREIYFHGSNFLRIFSFFNLA